MYSVKDHAESSAEQVNTVALRHFNVMIATRSLQSFRSSGSGRRAQHNSAG